jgi:hypothetical protein
MKKRNRWTRDWKKDDRQMRDKPPLPFIAGAFAVNILSGKTNGGGTRHLLKPPPVNHSHGLVLFGPRRCDAPF